ncbi:hypothetical protein H5410_020935 [Solanum commersonii]|uniref:Isopentenyltransferase n=1 Tax=Solanum commersonii TaxID=4109 RepID=A0A9J5ZFP0_SOLCO|nr:hypothetical protein H5410_020935 [Solanum commersonii]
MGKSHFSVDIATHFRGEIIQSDKMQVYKGLEIVTKKITHTENQGEIVPDSDFTAEDFCLQAIVYIEFFLKTQRVPIITGGSNSYIEKLVEDPVFMFKYKYDTCFIWIDVEQSVLNRRVNMRVDEMVNAANFLCLREETNIDEDDEAKKMILQSSIANIKRNTHFLISHQLDKIQWLINEKIWLVHHIIAIDVFKGVRKEAVDETLRNTVLQTCLDI